MEEDLVRYLIDYCQEWMLPEERKALRRISLTEEAKEMLQKVIRLNQQHDKLYGFNDEKTNELLKVGENRLEEIIAKRILDREHPLILNKCPKCNKLARTALAKQCRYCQHDWH
jgi:hypothetical protein